MEAGNSLKHYLHTNKKEITGKWIESVYASYPHNNRNLLKGENDPFLNPVGSTLKRCCVRIYEGMISGASPEEIRDSIDDIVRIRAVQGFTPSEAVSFLFTLRKTVCDYILLDENMAFPVSGIMEIDAWIDAAAALGFDIYMECRESIFTLRINEIKKSALRVE